MMISFKSSMATALVISFIVLNLYSTIVLSAPVTPEAIKTTDLPIDKDVDPGTPTEVLELQDRAKITFNVSRFKEIDHEVLQVVGDKSNIALSCHSLRNKSAAVEWKYNGIDRTRIRANMRQDNNTVYLDLSSGPPVALIECTLLSNPSLRNTTLVYTGDGNPPYLYNNNKSITAMVLNETTVRFPCILNYHLDNDRLQLFKDGKLVENKDNDFLSYTPGLGFYLNVTKVENPIGDYECRVVNSTDNDFLTVTLKNDKKFISVNYVDGDPQYFLTRNPEEKHGFKCKLPKSMFTEKFEWFYQWRNGTYEVFDAQDEVHSDSHYYSQTVNVTFANSTSNVTGIGCSGLARGSPTKYNNVLEIEVRDSYEPNMLIDPSNRVVYYKKGSNLTCLTSAYPVRWTWLKNRIPYSGQVYEALRFLNGISRSTLILNPSADDDTSNYTCVIENFLGSANHTFEVRLSSQGQENKPEQNTWLVVVAVVLGAMAAILGVVLIFFKVNVSPRRFNNDHIRRFFDGVPTKDTEYDILYPYASASYDMTREIQPDQLIFDKDKQLKKGNFGEVKFGRLVDKQQGTSTYVAIKTIKDDGKAEEEALENALVNFLNEIKFIQSLGHHPNVIGYVGAITSDIKKYSVYLVVEYCSEGDLSSFFKNFKNNGGVFHDEIEDRFHRFQCRNENEQYQHVLKTSHLMKWAEDIAAGMEYIASKNCVHNDLAARNILLGIRGTNSDDYNNPDPGQLVAKISDFGLSRNIDNFKSDYYRMFETDPERPRAVPVRWLSIEALKTYKFTTKSDVWSVGVTYWEMFTLGNKPYGEDIPDYKDIKLELIKYLESGKILSEAEFAPLEMWELMVQCWSESPNDRPTFSELRLRLLAINENRANEMQGQVDSHDISSAAANNYATVGFVENPAYNNIADAINEEGEEDDSGDSEEGEDTQ